MRAPPRDPSRTFSTPIARRVTPRPRRLSAFPPFRGETLPMTVLSNLFALLLVLSILVLLPESGHFFAARLFGIRPYIFSFGIGWRLVGLQKRQGRWRVSFGPPRDWSPPGPDTGTDFRISMIPFGGYVMLQGESLSEPVTGDSKEFRTRPRWQQFIVYGAGVTLNIILAWVLVTGLYIHRG